MNGKSDLRQRLRDQIVSAMHLGHIRPGDRLPSTRQIAREMGEDPRAVARAYRQLESEGLVEVRERSGIYAATQDRVGGLVLEETALWAAGVLVEAWKRGIAIPRIPKFFQHCTGVRRIRCAFVESSEDVITAFTYDLRECLGLETQHVRLDAPTTRRGKARLQPDTIAACLSAADLIVTTTFHAGDVRPLADALAKPMLSATLNADMVAAVERQLRTGRLVVICVDPRFGERLPLQYQELLAAGHELRVIYADDHRALAALDPSEPVLLTRAARDRLGELNMPLVYPHSPTISSSSALEIAELLIRFNLEAAGAQRSRAGGAARRRK